MNRRSPSLLSTAPTLWIVWCALMDAGGWTLGLAGWLNTAGYVALSLLSAVVLWQVAAR